MQRPRAYYNDKAYVRIVSTWQHTKSQQCLYLQTSEYEKVPKRFRSKGRILLYKSILVNKNGYRYVPVWLGRLLPENSVHWEDTFVSSKRRELQ